MYSRIILSLFMAIMVVSCAGQVFAGGVQYNYDAMGRVTEIDYGNGNVIEYTYDGVGNRISLTITGASNPSNPALNISPSSVAIYWPQWTDSFQVSNVGGGSMAWTAAVISGASWLSITDGTIGTDSGVIKFLAQANTDTLPRTGSIRIVAPGAVNSPDTVFVMQSGNHSGCVGGTGAYALNGVDQYLTVPDNSLLDINSSDFTIEAWIRMESIRGQCLIDKISSSGGYRLELGSGSVPGADLVIMYRSSSSQITEFRARDAFSNLDLDVYHYIAVSVSTSIPSVQIYVDGVGQYITNSGNATSVAPTDLDLHLGTVSSHAEYFHGSIDEVRISNVARTESEVSTYYASGEHLTSDVQTIALWHMNGDPGVPEKLDNVEGTSSLDLVEHNNPTATDGFNDCSGITSVEDVPLAVSELVGAYPNPFNPSTTIRFNLAIKQHARLVIYDVTGRMVAVLADRIFDKGMHDAVWRGLNKQGHQVPSGIYFCRLVAGDFEQTKKIVLLR